MIRINYGTKKLDVPAFIEEMNAILRETGSRNLYDGDGFERFGLDDYVDDWNMYEYVEQMNIVNEILHAEPGPIAEKKDIECILYFILQRSFENINPTAWDEIYGLDPVGATFLDEYLSSVKPMVLGQPPEHNHVPKNTYEVPVIITLDKFNYEDAVKEANDLLEHGFINGRVVTDYKTVGAGNRIIKLPPIDGE